MHFRRFKTSLISALSVVLLSGCVVGPEYKMPSTRLPSSWSAKRGDLVEKPPELAFWWRNFNDPLLNSFVEQAVRSNLSVQTALARVTEARAMISQESGGLFPTLSGVNSVQRTKISDLSAGNADNPSTQWRSGFDAGWEIDLFGGKRRSIEAAKYGLESAEEELRNTLLVLVADVSANYAQVRASQKQIELAKRAARSQRSTANLTKTKAEAGTTTVADVSRAKALAATTEARIPSLEIAKTAAINRLSILLALSPGALDNRLASIRNIPTPGKQTSVGIPANTLLSRPDVRKAERLLAQSTARIGVAEAARYPTLSLTGNIASQALSLSDLAQRSTISWGIGPALSIPLFRGGQLVAAVEVTKARRDASAANYQSAVFSAMEEVENAIVGFNQNSSRRDKLAVAASAYRQAYNATRIQYETGTLDYLNLLDTQRAQFEAENSLIESELAVATSFIALNKALGGGWSGEIEKKVPF